MHILKKGLGMFGLALSVGYRPSLELRLIRLTVITMGELFKGALMPTR
jgi:hypothetical protein